MTPIFTFSDVPVIPLSDGTRIFGISFQLASRRWPEYWSFLPNDAWRNFPKLQLKKCAAQYYLGTPIFTFSDVPVIPLSDGTRIFGISFQLASRRWPEYWSFLPNDAWRNFPKLQLKKCAAQYYLGTPIFTFSDVPVIPLSDGTRIFGISFQLPSRRWAEYWSFRPNDAWRNFPKLQLKKSAAQYYLGTPIFTSSDVPVIPLSDGTRIFGISFQLASRRWPEYWSFLPNDAWRNFPKLQLKKCAAQYYLGTPIFTFSDVPVIPLSDGTRIF